MHTQSYREIKKTDIDGLHIGAVIVNVWSEASGELGFRVLVKISESKVSKIVSYLSKPDPISINKLIINHKNDYLYLVTDKEFIKLALEAIK